MGARRSDKGRALRREGETRIICPSRNVCERSRRAPAGGRPVIACVAAVRGEKDRLMHPPPARGPPKRDQNFFLITLLY